MRSLVLVAAAALAALGCAGPAGTPTVISPAPVPTAVPTAAGGLDAHGCPMTEAGIHDALSAARHTLQVGDELQIHDGTISVSARNGRYDASDSVPQWAGLDIAAPPQVGTRGAPIEVREVEGSLTGLSASAWPLDGFSGQPGDLPAYAGPPALPLEVVLDAGVASVTLPAEAGRWVIELGQAWQTDCFTGSGFAFFTAVTR